MYSFHPAVLEGTEVPFHPQGGLPGKPTQYAARPHAPGASVEESATTGLVAATQKGVIRTGQVDLGLGGFANLEERPPTVSK